MMIIHEEKIIEIMNDESNKISLPRNVKELLMANYSFFQENVYEHIENNNLEGLTLNKAAKVESAVIRLIFKALDMNPIVNLEDFGYKDVDVDEISYSFIPKNKELNGYTVDTLVLFFKHIENEQLVSTTLPFYHVSDKEKEYLFKAGEKSIENTSLS